MHSEKHCSLLGYISAHFSGSTSVSEPVTSLLASYHYAVGALEMGAMSAEQFVEVSLCIISRMNDEPVARELIDNYMQDEFVEP